ncbi:MAG: ExeM/NucH family extracellular endonuclease [Spirosomataceae bacterium]
MSNTAGSTTNNLTIAGWFLTETGGGARDNEQYAVDTGSDNTGDMYSYGSAGSTERALGQLRSGTLIGTFGACFTNNTGTTITSLATAYNGEQWRLGNAGRTDQMNFQYSTNATDLVTGTWTNVAALNFVSPDQVTVGAKNGNAASNRTALSATISSLSIANGATFWIRWNDVDASGADDGLAVDDFSLTPQNVVLPNLTVNDVSLNEGNAGTTSFTFTVSLSAPAGAGGVTFDIATADGTATAPGDYTAKSLTAQTIPAGSSTYSFTVLVNGEITPEVNETFFVNVTNVTGAAVTDGQGQGTIVNDDIAPNLTVNDVSLNEGNAGTTTFTFTVSLSAPAGAGGVTFDIATADGTAISPGDYTAKSLTSQTIPAGSSTYTFDVLVNGDAIPEVNETFFVNVTNATNAIVTDGQGQGTIVNDDITRIHDVQGNGAATPIPGSTVTIEGIVVGDFQNSNQLSGFFLQEEDGDADADPATSEGIFVFCSSCPTAVAEGQKVKVTGTVSEFFNMTQVTASTAGSVVVTDAGSNLGQVTPATIDLPIVGFLNDYYEAREGMKVTFVDNLTVAEHFELTRYGQIELYEGGRPQQFTETNAPSVAGYAAHLDNLNRRKVILDDDNNLQNAYLSPNQAEGLQALYYPRANGGFSVGAQGTDFFRAGDQVNGLTGVLHWSFAGQTGTDAWRIRPTAANPATFTVANTRPISAPAVGGAIKAASVNLLNYFTTIDATSSSNSGPCGPDGTQDCRGADSNAELIRQRERASIVLCGLNADVYGLVELENTTPSATITDLLGAVNTRCGGAHPYAFVNTGGTLGTDAIRVQLIYRTGVLSPVGSPLVDLDPIHSRPPTAQTFDVVDATNPAFGKRFTVIVNHFKSKGSSAGLPGDTDINDGTGASNETRVAQANRLLTWINSTVLPAAGDPDILLLGDFNSYAKEDPITTLTGGGFTDLETSFLGNNAYSYLFDGQLGHLDYAFSSASLTPQITGIEAWHINADEVPVFDYNDEVKDTGESAFEEKPDGSALVPPRVVYQPASPYRASDHDPVLVGLFQAADLSITKTDGVTTATPGGSVTYTITASNAGPDPVTGATVTDNLPAILTGTWICVGAGGGTCTAMGSGNISDAVNLPVGGSVTYTLTAAISASATGTLSNTATVSGGSISDPNPGNNSATDTDMLSPQADLGITKTDGVTTVTPGGSVTYTITASNSGPSNANGVTVADVFPASLTGVSWTCVGAGGGTCTAMGSGNISDAVNLPSGGSVTYTVSATIDASATGTLSNTATVAAPGGVTDPNPGNNSATDTDILSPQADVSITVADSPDPVTAGSNLTYTLTVNNAGLSNASAISLSNTLPAGTTFVSLSSPGGWSATTPAVGSGGTVSASTASLAPGSPAVFTLVVAVAPAVADQSVLSNTATVTSSTSDPVPGNNSATATTTVSNPCIITPYTVTGGGSYCSGGSGVAVGLSGSQTGFNYQLLLNGNPQGSPLPGTGDPLSFGNQLIGGSYTVVAAKAINPGCTASMSGSVTVTEQPVPTSALMASQTDVCPNTQVTLNAQCSIPNATVNWNPGAPTVVPDAPTTSYVYKASCTLDGCTGNESSVEVRTHRILVDIKDLGVGAQPKTIIGAVKDNLAPTNLIKTPPYPRFWTILATGCSASESAVFKLSGPVNFTTVDNNPPYAIFANVGADYFSIDHPNYGNGGSFVNGTYTLTAELRSQDGVGGPFPKNRVGVGALLATRTLQFTLADAMPVRVGSEGFNELSRSTEVSWAELTPNPVQSSMRLKVSGQKGQPVEATLLDAAGRRMLQRSFVPASEQHQEEFEVSHLGTGMYFLHLHSGPFKATIKVIKIGQ